MARHVYYPPLKIPFDTKPGDPVVDEREFYCNEHIEAKLSLIEYLKEHRTPYENVPTDFGK